MKVMFYIKREIKELKPVSRENKERYSFFGLDFIFINI